MSILSLEDISLSLGDHPLLDKISFKVEAKNKIALVGRNGQGKSTLLRIMAQQESFDDGLIKAGPSQIALLKQELPTQLDITTYDYVSQGLQNLGELLTKYHHLTHDTPKDAQDDDWLEMLHTLQKDIEHQNGWDLQNRIEKIMTQLDIPANKKIRELSGGWRRRLDLAKTLILEPDLLLLDEPTNHLDIEAIEWLEKTLILYPKSLIFITHDRRMMGNIADSIIELDRGQLYHYQCDYETYLKRKAKREADEQVALKKFDDKLSQEEAWLRQGVKARRKRNQGRLRDLERLREERKAYREQLKRPGFKSNVVSDSRKTIITAENISFQYPNHLPIIDDFSFYLQKGEKVAIIGKNGQGKTTLIKVLLGLLPLQSGKLHHSPTNQVAYFDQKRENLKPDATLIDNVAMGDDFVEINGKRQHIIGYLGEFLFSPKQCQQKASQLSGGEQNRLLLAQLFSKPANILVLDEPTNDLDLESLELLESLLLSYQGTILLISHDRAFVDNVATRYVAFDFKGRLEVGVGGFSDWQDRHKQLQEQAQQAVQPKKAKPAAVKKAPSKNKLSYKEQRECDSLPQIIAQLEAKIEALQQEMLAPDFYQKPQSEVKAVNDALAQYQQELEHSFERWSLLEEKKDSF